MECKHKFKVVKPKIVQCVKCLETYMQTKGVR